eukprot:910092-Amphidinium_carterae.1
MSMQDAASGYPRIEVLPFEVEAIVVPQQFLVKVSSVRIVHIHLEGMHQGMKLKTQIGQQPVLV